MKILLSILLLISIVAKAQVFGVVANPVGKDSMTAQFDTLMANEETFSWVQHMRGYMQQLPARTCTGGNNNTLVLTAVPANWVPAGGNNTQFPNDGITNGTAFPWLTKVQRECAFNSAANVYASGSPQLIWTGFIPGASYTIEFSASITPSISSARWGADYRVLGISLYGPETLYAQNPAGTANVSGKTTTFTNCVPDATGKFSIYVNGAALAITDGTGGTVSVIRIRQN